MVLIITIFKHSIEEEAWKKVDLKLYYGNIYMISSQRCRVVCLERGGSEKFKMKIYVYLPVVEWVALVRISLETYIFILNYSLPPRSEQLIGAHANEIKHDHSPVVIFVLDPRYD